MHETLAFSHQRLHQHGYRLTPQRYVIFQVIQQARSHLTLEQIVEQVHVQNPCVTLSTIYRTLDLLKELEVELIVLHLMPVCRVVRSTIRTQSAVHALTFLPEPRTKSMSA